MVSMELREWYKGILCDPMNFQFAKVTKANGVILKTYSSTCTRRHPASRLAWPPEAIMFARKMEEAQAKGSSAVESWKRLPVARTIGIYQPFTDAQKKIIDVYSSAEHDLNGLVDLAQQLECLGAAHITDTEHSATNPHLPADLETADISQIFDRLWPHESFFDMNCNSHPDHALSTLINWLMTTAQLRHLPSNTWLAGPGGSRWVIAILLHLVRALTSLDNRSSVPDTIVQLFSVG
ncbi:hypothetical protein FRC10_005568, partial [Ceratobasidium sp. 414]